MTSIDNDGIKTIPVHMNVVFASEYFSFYSNLDENKFTTIVNELDDDELYILDFCFIRNTLASDSFTSVADGLLNKKVLMVNLKSSTYNTFLGNFGNRVIDFSDEKLGKCLRTEQFPDKIKLPDLSNFSYLNKFLEKKCRENIPDDNNPTWISSNVFINKQFDLKKMFGSMDTVKVVVYLIAHKIEGWIKEESAFKLISSSFNGCILANLLSIILGKEHISIPHLGPGPEIVEKDHRYMDYIKKGDKFIYIYDFIAFGNEQKTVSTIVNSLNAEIWRSLGLTYFKPSPKEIDKTDYIVDFKKIVDHIYIAAEEEDLKKIIGGKNG